MSLPVHTVRRATINDLVVLRTIWSEERFAVGELERRFTEFQVVETTDGKILATLALQIQGNQGHIHSEGFGAPEHSELLRDVLWERLKKVAQNHGLIRVWTNLDNGYWGKVQFRVPQAEEVAKLPPLFGSNANWKVLQLKEETNQPVSLENELAIFREAQKAETERFHQQARTMRLLASLIAFAALAAVVIGGYLWYQYYQNPDKFKKSGDAPPPDVQAVPLAPPAPVPPPATNTPAKPPTPK